MGGNRRHQALNIFVVWFLTGMWHGASWNFIIWGVYFGIIVTLEKYTLLKIKRFIPSVLLHCYSMLLVIIGWGIFYFDDFGKMDIRTATVLEAERVPKTDKLLKLTIDTGIDRRVIVSGIAEYYTPEDMVGRQICILANLKPRVIKGIESKGMILMARQNDGTMRFITPQETVVNGAEIG